MAFVRPISPVLQQRQPWQSPVDREHGLRDTCFGMASERGPVSIMIGRGRGSDIGLLSGH
jgi:hypothetical protein